MMATKRSGQPRRPAKTASAKTGDNVLALDVRRIEKALRERARYKYVHPRVEREGLGWKIVSPNCSRNIDPQGGEIDIAWLVPSSQGGWLLYSRDHSLDCWQLRGRGALPALLAQLSADPQREFWQ
jgi:hypothetical protein